MQLNSHFSVCYILEKGAKAKPKKQKGSDESAFEESDDGDEEGRELDYISDSSERYTITISINYTFNIHIWYLRNWLGMLD